MNYNEWFDTKIQTLGNLTIKEFGAIVYRATLRGDIRNEEKPLNKYGDTTLSDALDTAAILRTFPT